MPFVPQSGPVMLLKALLPPELWVKVEKAANDIPQIIEHIKQTIDSVDARLKSIEETCANLEELAVINQTRLDLFILKMDPSAAAFETSLTGIEERVSNGRLTDEDVELLKMIPVTDPKPN